MFKDCILCCVALIFASVFSCGQCSCRNANWLTSFDSKGLSSCNDGREAINGLYRHSNHGSSDFIHLLEEAKCCSWRSEYANDGYLGMYPNWLTSFDKNNHWNLCPIGYFLNGLWRDSKDQIIGFWVNRRKGTLNLIEDAYCTKPDSHPYYYGACYDQDVGLSFDNKGWSNCREGYFITGLYRGGCDKLYCIEKFKCCQMAPSPARLDSLSAVKTRVMDKTLKYISYLALYLGYGWSLGCMSNVIGENFYRVGDTWKADVRPEWWCEGYKWNHRLKINYGDWDLGIKDIRYGDPVSSELTPETLDSGKIINDHDRETTQIISREVKAIRTVTHTKTSSWKKSEELGLEVSYIPPSGTGGPSITASYKFAYETSASTLDSTKKEQVNTLRADVQKTVGPFSETDWKLVIRKTRVTVPYTATIIARFSAELQGFLRWGQGWNGAYTNYHHKYRGSENRPTFNYRFGGRNSPFYEALKHQSQANSLPWLWSDMLSAHADGRTVINQLTNEGLYEFTLTGKFDDISGRHISVEFSDAKPVGRDRRTSVNNTATPIIVADPAEMKVLTTVAKERIGDPPPVFPDPPKVVIDEGYNNDLEIPLYSVEN